MNLSRVFHRDLWRDGKAESLCKDMRIIIIGLSVLLLNTVKIYLNSSRHLENFISRKQ